MPGIDRDRWRTLAPLLDRALELTGDDRDRWLAELDVSTPEVAGDVRSLLAHDAAAERDGFLVGSVQLSLAGLPLGAWTLERPLGQGGMGSVWLARRNDGRFEGVAAVKLLNLALVAEPMQRRFQREGSALARLAHPGISRLLDAGVAPGGQPYLVLEYVDGERIDEWADRRRLDAAGRVRLVLQVLDAVAHAHANLIVHRDLKPSNILVTESGTVKLLDFGIAKLLDGDDARAPGATTVDGAHALTPEYAAPEQFVGDPITTATDVYALGVLLYVLLSGHHPTADGCRTTAEVLHALVDREPAPLPLGDLGTVVARALRKAPAERYQTASALALDLQRWLGGEPVSARPQTLGYRLRRFVGRHRAAVVAGALAAGALVGATAFSTAQMREARRQRDDAVEARRRADAQADFESVLLSQLGDTPLTMRQLLDRGRRVLENARGVDPAALPVLLLQLAERYEELGDGAMRRALLVRAESLAVAQGRTGALATVRCHLADHLRTLGRYDEARAAYDRVAAQLAAAPDPRAEATCLQLRAGLENETGHPEASGPAVRRAIAISDSLHDTTSMGYFASLITLAGAHDRERRPREAVALMRRVVQLMDASGRGTTVARNVALHDLAYLLRNVGETGEASRLFAEVVRQLDAADPGAVIHVQPLIHHAHAALYQGDLATARAAFARLVRQSEAGGRAYWIGRGLSGLARAEIAAGDLDAAERTIARFRALGPVPELRNTDDELTDVRVLEAFLARARGDQARAHVLVVEALLAHQFASRPTRIILRSSLLLAGETALALGRPDDALAWARAARRLAARDSLTETRSAYVGEARLLEARVRLARREPEAARRALRAATAAISTGGGADHPLLRQAAAVADSLAAAERDATSWPAPAPPPAEAGYEPTAR